MTVGIPGTGLGGLFYFLLVALMPFRELVLTLRSRSSLARWSRVGFHLLVLAAMLGVLWGEAWLLDRALSAVRERFGPGGHEPARDMFLRAGQVAALTSVGVLAALLAGVAALRFTPLCAGCQPSADPSTDASPRHPARWSEVDGWRDRLLPSAEADDFRSPLRSERLRGTGRRGRTR